jgi:putative endonuclease
VKRSKSKPISRNTLLSQRVLEGAGTRAAKPQGKIRAWKSSFSVIPAKAGIQDSLMSNFYVYILSSERNGTLYIGVTAHLLKRVYEHKNDLADGFSRKYHIHNLVWYEIHQTPGAAITREKQLKAWKRSWKLQLTEEANPDWKDLYECIRW